MNQTAMANKDGRHRVKVRVLWMADKLGHGDELHGVGTYFRSVFPKLPCTAFAIVLRGSDRITHLLKQEGVTVVNFNVSRFDPITLWKIIAFIRDNEINVLHLHGFGCSFFGRLASLISGIPTIDHQHDSINAPPWVLRSFERGLAWRTFKMIAVSETVGEFCIKKRYVAREKIEVLLNGIESRNETRRPEDLNLRSRLNFDSATPVVGSLTRLSAEKGVEYLVRAFEIVVQKIPRARLVIFGDGEDRPKLESLVGDLGLEGAIYFMGFEGNAQSYLSEFDCFALTSIEEGFPFAMLEALAAKLPVVVTRVGGIPEVIVDGKNGLMVPSRDVCAIGAAIVKVLEDASLSERLSRGALTTAGKLSVDRHVSQLHELYVTAVSTET